MFTITRNIISFLSTSALIMALSFESITGIGANLEANRSNVQARVRLAQTSYSGTNEAAVLANMSALDSYKETLDIEKALYVK